MDFFLSLSLQNYHFTGSHGCKRLCSLLCYFFGLPVYYPFPDVSYFYLIYISHTESHTRIYYNTFIHPKCRTLTRTVPKSGRSIKGTNLLFIYVSDAYGSRLILTVTKWSKVECIPTFNSSWLTIATTTNHSASHSWTEFDWHTNLELEPNHMAFPELLQVAYTYKTVLGKIRLTQNRNLELEPDHRTFPELLQVAYS